MKQSRIQDNSGSRRVFDCFTMFNEVEILRLRLNELYESVDFFVVCEATTSFSGNKKPLYFDDHREMFRPFLDKIRHIVVDDMPQGGDRWAREHHQRSAIRRGLSDAGEADTVIISDVDEIIRPSSIDYIRRHEGYFMFDMPMYQFYMNMRTIPKGWIKAFAYTWSLDSEVGDFNRCRQREAETFARFTGRNHRIENGGWHFTFLGGADRVREKLSAYSHTQQWQQKMLRPGEAERQMSILRDVGGGKQLEYCEIDDTFPQYLQSHLSHFHSINFVKSAPSRITDLVIEFAKANRTWQMAEARERYLTAELARMSEFLPSSANLALNKPAMQSSISSKWSHRSTCEAEARGGNNGAIGEPGGYGFHTDREINPWWQVDLGDNFIVEEVRVHNRKGGTANRLRHFSILMSSDGKNWTQVDQKTDETVFETTPYILRLNPAAVTRYTRIQLNGDNFLHFDQCQVYGREINKETWAAALGARSETLLT